MNDKSDKSWDRTVKTALIVFAIVEALALVPVVIHKLNGG